QHDDDDRYGVRDVAKLEVSALQVVDVGARPVPSNDLAPLVAKRLDADQEPAVRSVAAPQAGLDLRRLPGCQAGAPLFQQETQVGGVEGDLPSPAGGLLL